MDGWIDGWVDGWIDRLINRCMCIHIVTVLDGQILRYVCNIYINTLEYIQCNVHWNLLIQHCDSVRWWGLLDD
jgi:hypothetical protein